MFEISYEARKALDLLKENNYECYLVGGCVRDYILNRDFNDFDITTNALPDQIKSVFSSYKTIDTGIKHGTVTVIINSIPLEITTFRIDGEYLDNRHPKDVSFSKNLQDDLSRRDFTINALAYNGEIVDLFGGLNDIKNRQIRCVGIPDKRFNEDGLRIMRALRFSSILDFEIEENTSDSLIRNKHLLKNISSERIYTELCKLVCGVGANRVISRYGSVLGVLFDKDYFSDNGVYFDAISNDLCQRLALFFLDDPCYEKDLKSLRLDNKTLLRVCNAIKNYNKPLPQDKVSIKKYIYENGYENLYDICMLKKARGIDVDDILSTYTAIIQNDECCTVNQLKINGNDVRQFGFENIEVGQILKKILNLVIEEKLENNTEKILEYIKEIKK